MRLTAVIATLAVALPLFAQPEPVPAAAVDRFKQARDRIADGRLELAAESLQAFLDAKPTDPDYLALEKQYGPTVFEKLSRVVSWSDNKAADAAARKSVDTIITASRAASKNAATAPDRVEKFVRNLGATPAEREFAIQALRPAGAAAVPELVKQLRGTKDVTLRSGILDSLTKLPASTVPGLLAAADPAGDLTADLRAGILKAVVNHTDAGGKPDVGLLVDKAESDPTPLLWHCASDAASPPQLKADAVALLETLTGGVSARRTADAELLRLAEPFAAGKGKDKFTSLDTQTGKVTLWVWDTTGPKAVTLDQGDAAEYVALKYLKWAVAANPKGEAGQLAFLAVGTERGVERGGFGDLKATEPETYKLLANAPDSHLSALLDQSLTEKRTALAVGVLQAMSDRGQKDDARGGTARPSAYATALSYPDPRVQFAAAVALLRSTTTPSPGTAARVVEVLRRGLGSDGDTAGGGSAGRVLIADPTVARGDRLASHFRDLGFVTEQFASGRQLLRRVAKASDFDLIAVDRHSADPLLNDVLSHLAADPNAARRPVLVVASSDRAKPVPVEPLLLRLAVLVAATDVEEHDVPPPYRFDPKFPPVPKPNQTAEQAREEARWRQTDLRNAALNAIASARVKRLQRLVDSAELPPSKTLSDRLEVRLPQLTYGVLAAEFGVDTPTPQRPAESSYLPSTGGKPAFVEVVPPPPDAYKVLADFNDRIRNLERLNEAIAAITDTAGLGKIVEQVEGQFTADGKKKFEAILRKASPARLLLDVSDYRDRKLEAEVQKQVRGFKGVAVVPEPLGAESLADDLKASIADPAQRPRTDVEKQATAKLAAAWLKKIATGEVSGYTITDETQAALRAALEKDELTLDAVEALAKLGSGDTQVALVRLSANGGRPLPVRTAAADAAARQVQQFGKHTPAEVRTALAQAADAEKDPVLKGKLTALARLVADKPADVGAGIAEFKVPLRTGAPPKQPDPKDPPKEPKPDPKEPPKDPKPPEENK